MPDKKDYFDRIDNVYFVLLLINNRISLFLLVTKTKVLLN